jgi:hypothetical protein
MTLFRKKPVVIEAMQFTDRDKDRVLSWMTCTAEPIFVDGKPALKIRTLEGDMIASLGDWIIKGVKGEYYPCKPDIFEATYEPVESAHTMRKAEQERSFTHERPEPTTGPPILPVTPSPTTKSPLS